MQRQAELAEREPAVMPSRIAELAEQRAANEALQAELVELRRQVAAAKAANEARPDQHDYDEADDPRPVHRPAAARGRLGARPAATTRVRGRRHAERPGQGLRRLRAVGRRRQAAGAGRGQAHPRDAQAGQQQAKLYADCLEQQFGQRPVIFYTNGYEHWIWDDTRYPPRPVQGFYTRDELELLIQRRTTRKPLAELPINDAIVERHYQHRAIRRIGEAFEADRQRKALLVMATGRARPAP